MTKVVVYGTLRKGYGNHHLLETSSFLGNCLTKDKYSMFASGIPFVNKKINKTQIVGEVYEVTEPVLRRLDMLEGYSPEDHENSWYKREEIPVVMEDQSETNAFIYFNNVETGTEVESGDYTVYRKRQQESLKEQVKSN